jgi:16S rRNA (cytosine1402-N4)-methyltransferase
MRAKDNLVENSVRSSPLCAIAMTSAGGRAVKRVRPGGGARMLGWAVPSFCCAGRGNARTAAMTSCAQPPWPSQALSAPHAPVLLAQVIAQFADRPMRVFVDGTVGAGGHAAALLDACDIERYIGLDKDASALALAGARLEGKKGVELLRADFRNMPAVLRAAGVDPGDVGGILLDVGVSSMQLDTAERGFSFMRDGPLDMRMTIGDDAGGVASAADLVNTLSQSELGNLFRRYGEDPRARLMADRVVRGRNEQGPITSTLQLADILSAGRRKTARGIHPATLCFQALRIAVNGELDALRDVLPGAVELLEPGAGRLAVITFHSLEDRIVKQAFRDMAKETGGVAQLTKRPIVADEAECEVNARSRSAKLRVVERLELGQVPRVGKVNKYRPDGCFVL